MLLIISVLISATAVVSILRAFAPARLRTAHLGSMSEQWLAELRAAHPS